MVEMAPRARPLSPPGAKKPDPLFSVLIGFETLAERISQIENGPVVTPGSLLEWLDRAEFERIVRLPTNRIECSSTPGSSPGPPKEPSRCATASARTSTATGRPSGATSTTSSPLVRAG